MGKNSAYASAGVDLAVSNQLKNNLPSLLASTRRPEVLGEVGGFGGLFALKTGKYKAPVLVSSVDGVGTKLKVAFASRRHNTIGQDLVNHCVNDITVIGAKPLFFLDYIGAGSLKRKVFNDIVQGFATGCRENNCSLVGGETAQMPGFYKSGEYDVSGTVVGVVEKNCILDGRTIRAGDKLIGIAASGLHTNGYSLARKILFDKMKLKPSSLLPGLGITVANELLKVHVSYGSVVQKLLKKFNSCARRLWGIKGLVHITGGGFIDNIPRVLPEGCDAVVIPNTWDVLPIYKLLQEKGCVSEGEMHEVFNMGIGMVAVVRGDQSTRILRSIRAQKMSAWEIGFICAGNQKVQLTRSGANPFR
jgi:phosphoribosylformylglycinamidine cyclo-ligase